MGFSFYWGRKRKYKYGRLAKASEEKLVYEKMKTEAPGKGFGWSAGQPCSFQRPLYVLKLLHLFSFPSNSLRTSLVILSRMSHAGHIDPQGSRGVAVGLCHQAVSPSRDCIEKKTCGAAEENRFFEPNTVILKKSVFCASLNWISLFLLFYRPLNHVYQLY